MYAILGSRGGEANDNTQNLKAGFITKHNETLVWVLYFQWTLSSYQAFKCLSCYKAFPDPKVFDEAGFVKTIIIPSFISRLLKLTPGLPRWLSSKQAAYQAGDSSSILGLGRPPGEKKKWQPTPVFLLWNLEDRGAWGVIVHGIPRMGHDWATKQQQNYHTVL